MPIAGNRHRILGPANPSISGRLWVASIALERVGLSVDANFSKTFFDSTFMCDSSDVVASGLGFGESQRTGGGGRGQSAGRSGIGAPCSASGLAGRLSSSHVWKSLFRQLNRGL